VAGDDAPDDTSSMYRSAPQPRSFCDAVFSSGVINPVNDGLRLIPTLLRRISIREQGSANRDQLAEGALSGCWKSARGQQPILEGASPFAGQQVWRCRQSTRRREPDEKASMRPRGADGDRWVGQFPESRSTEGVFFGTLVGKKTYGSRAFGSGQNREAGKPERWVSDRLQA
jgi:hypothetical protein